MHIDIRKKCRGFSLVEIMVGLTIGLITVLIISQVMQVAEARKRSTTSGADSVVNAALGLYTIERDAKNAGYGIATVGAAVGCTARAQHGGTNLDFNLLPVMIADSANGAPDQIRFLASSKNGITIPAKITQDHPADGDKFFVESELGIETGDLVLAVPAAGGAVNCAVAQVSNTAQNQVWHSTGPLNQGDLPTAYVVGDYLFNLGDFSDRTYSITADNFLSLSDLNLKTGVPNELSLYPNIIQLQAVYGKDAVGNDGVVDTWDAVAPASSAQWQRVRAVRIALVARGQTMEPDIVALDGTAAASTCDSMNPHPAAICWRPDPAGKGVAINVNLNNANPSWQRYRYRVMETTVPLRNVIWQQ